MPTDSTIAEQLGDRVETFSIGDVPESTRRHARYLVLDSLAVQLGGTQLEQGREIIDLWASRGGSEEATVPYAEQKLPIDAAAYVNGYLANLLDYDDTYSGRAIGHPGATVIPPALATAEANDLDGETFLEGVLAGYELSIRVGDAIMPTPDRSRLVVGTGTWQVFGSAIATAKLLGCDSAQLADTLGITGVSAPVPFVRKVGIESNDIQWMKNNYGQTCQSGVIAAQTAERGFRGNRSILDGPKGFWRIAASDSFDEEILLGPFESWDATAEVSFKPYSSCRWTHAALDCIEALRPANGVESIERVTVETFEEASRLDTDPSNVLDAQFSMPYVVAISLLDYGPGYEWLSSDRLSDPHVRSLIDRTAVVEDPEFTARYESTGQMSTRVTIEYDDGSSESATVDDPSGDPENPIAYEEIERKFDALVEPILGTEQTAELRTTVLDLSRKTSVRDLAALLDTDSV